MRRRPANRAHAIGRGVCSRTASRNCCAAGDSERFVLSMRLISRTSMGCSMTRARSPAAWVTEDVRPVPRNIYGVTKVAAEDLCELVHRLHRLPCLVLRTARFFPEADDRPEVREAFQAAIELSGAASGSRQER